ncbi:acetyl-coenzyme A transporter 1-domain-containing protein, partial [Peziza echinospora]
TDSDIEEERKDLLDAGEGEATGSFFDLSPTDKRNFMMLVLLYFLQGVPMGLAMGSVPFLLKSKLSYGQIGVFTLAAYPYSLKLAWSPIVDAVWSRRMGRRKSWIVPIQTISGFMLIWLGANAKELMEHADKKLHMFTFTFFMLVMLCATQDIAVDGWAITLMSQQNLSYASTAQTVGLTAGQFLSFTVFLAFNSPDFANRYFRSVPQDVGIFTLGGYLTFWGWAYLIVTVGLALINKEERTGGKEGVKSVYKTMWQVMKLKHVQTFVVIHLISKIGFQANDAVTNLKLLDKGFSQEDLALTVLIDFPFEIALGYYAGKWCAYFPSMKLWMWAFIGRLVAAVLAHITVWLFPRDGVVGTGYLVVVILEHVFSTFTSTVMFVAVNTFHAKIADPKIGGTYMTLLATVSNLGGTFPRFFVLKLVDALTGANCLAPTPSPLDPASDTSATPFEPFSCALEPEKHRCKDLGGSCKIYTDGYYTTNIVCVAVGVVTFVWYIRPRVNRLMALPLRAWRE